MLGFWDSNRAVEALVGKWEREKDSFCFEFQLKQGLIEPNSVEFEW